MKKESPVGYYDKEKARKALLVVNVMELFFVMCVFLLIVLIAYIGIFASILIIIAIAVVIVTACVWEEWYCRKTHFMTYVYERRRQENGITHCPYCGSVKLFDNDNGSFCGNCNQKVKRSKRYMIRENFINLLGTNSLMRIQWITFLIPFIIWMYIWMFVGIANTKVDEVCLDLVIASYITIVVRKIICDIHEESNEEEI